MRRRASFPLLPCVLQPLHDRADILGCLQASDADEAPINLLAVSSLRPLKKTSRSAWDIARMARASVSIRHSSDQVLKGWPVISEMAVVSRE
jgi:hypothetical protein